MSRHSTKWCGALVAGIIASVCTAVFSVPAQASSSHSTSPTTPPAVAGVSKHAVAAGTHPSTVTQGYWIASSSGGVGSYGGAPFHSSLGSNRINAPVVALAPMPDGGGYWLAAADGGVFAFGDAVFYGSLAGRQINAPVVAMAPTPSGHGYWLAASDGGVFAFGDAAYAGSLSGLRPAAPVVALKPTPDARGYWLAAADGGVFAFGDAHFFGSLAGMVLKSPIVGAAASADGSGYWLTAADGGVFAFGDATFRGSASGDVPPGDGIVAIAVGPGVANFFGVSGNFSAPPVPKSVGSEPAGAVGYDISWPQCSGPFPAPSALAIVGINDGMAFTGNPCFAQEAAWAGLSLSVYVNLNAPDPANPSQFASGPAGVCPPGAAACDSFNYGYNTATDALGRVKLAGYAPRDVWLDIETGNVWSPDTGLNDQVIAGAITALRKAGATPGIYSTAYQFNLIAGAFNPSTAEWLATGVGLTAPSPGCATPSFTGGRVTLVQGSLGPFDGNFAC